MNDKQLYKSYISTILKKGRWYKHFLEHKAIYTNKWKNKLLEGVGSVLDKEVFGEYNVSSGYCPKHSTEEIQVLIAGG